MKEAELKKKL
jgi:hypothetical protein